VDVPQGNAALAKRVPVHGAGVVFDLESRVVVYEAAASVEQYSVDQYSIDVKAFELVEVVRENRIGLFTYDSIEGVLAHSAREHHGYFGNVVRRRDAVAACFVWRNEDSGAYVLV